ncbi:Acyl carrier protein phosphodiesterase [Sinobacterium norvegicum]|uniref:Acyl carrier protein phosphodiesterase n=1 Tax=Sinobacterium norvegicum TaxID=1641715 RepID=A0ABN8EIZ2_9GAMM|nr:ACP phosphodiesterase [Sinobacterium norvegicum]CAH0991317.1 Acyl carrier protein phosphodiesterase [Sinobacterium norvegicum]
MNYLAHLHIAEVCHSHFAGNLLGDFVKGSPEQQHPAEVAAGIRLHRFVDSFTDQHPLVKQAKTLFVDERRRYAPIALDMFWDHCLAKHWQQYHSKPLSHFNRHAAAEVARYQDNLPERYQRLMRYMWPQRWLESYQEIDNIGLSLARMSQRSPRMAPLADCIIDLQQHYHALEEIFPEFYPLLLTAAQQQTVNR